MTKPLPLCLALIMAGALVAAPPEISNVQASQREGTKLVDITYDAADADGDLLKMRVEISDDDGKTYSIPAFSFTGDIGEGIAPGTGKHIVWDAGVDWDGEYSDLMRVKVFAIDAKGFPGMEWGNEVPPGGFLLGQDGGAEGSGPSRHVNIPWSYWMGKYEVTRQQYCDFLNAALVAGLVYRDGTTSVHASATMPPDYACPIDALLCNIGDKECLRWNVNNFEVVDGLGNYPMIVTWYGAMAFCHFYGYDLPTEAEWEKAARGPDHDDEDEHLLYPWGNEISSSYAAYNVYKPVGYYNGNQTPIGPDTINGYGLYDVIGNASEWTRSRKSMSDTEFTIESYPQQETLYTARHWPHAWSNRIYKGATNGAALYKRNSNEATKLNGFRVVRRHNADDQTATCSISENFNAWPQKTSSGTMTITTATGEWGIGSSGRITNEGVDGSLCLWANGGVHLTPPPLKGQICFVRVKVKNMYGEARSLWVEGGNERSNPVSIPAVTETFTTVTAQAPMNSDSEDTRYFIYLENGLVIDDLEIWTVPREKAGE